MIHDSASTHEATKLKYAGIILERIVNHTFFFLSETLSNKKVLNSINFGGYRWLLNS